ncbi:MAG TPA: acyl carrier protein [Ignavibacteriales bacterium]|nr:acyl carrier protein [Ignavibacteriales bacterium]
MERNEIESRVKKVIAEVLKINQDNITPEANFIFDLGADSMQSLMLVAGLEEEFSVTMDEDKALEVQSVAGAVAFISSVLQEQEHAK